MLHEVDQHISNVLKTLEESGQADNTIVMFCPDHGEYAASHGTLMEKWHSAYEEIIHVPMVVRFPASMHHVPGGLKQISEITSHIDILPTILGLSGMDASMFDSIKENVKLKRFNTILDPVGVDLSPLILGEEIHVKEPDTKKRRKGVLFMTHDTITEPFGRQAEPIDLDSGMNKDVSKLCEGKELTDFEVYLGAVARLCDEDLWGNDETYPSEVEKLKQGPVCQPNNVHAVINNKQWKLVRYFDPNDDKPQNNQYELYDLNTDPNEQLNLLCFDEEFPTPIDENGLPNGMSTDHIRKKALKLMILLKELEFKML